MSQISLTASMRSNLLSLQNTASLMSQTQERLASGKKVNSAIDNPSAYYTAQSLNNRASDLSGLLDSMGQAISTIKAADEGIEAITNFVEQAKAVATSALDTTDKASRGKYQTQFNAILSEIDKLAKDSGYKGINLLQGGSLEVTFNEGRDNKLTITGVNAGKAGLSLTDASAWATAAGNVSTADEITAQNGAINAAITAANNAINTLRGYSSDFGNSYSIVQTREEFTTNLINVLEEGADKLTLADMNEESANMVDLSRYERRVS